MKVTGHSSETQVVSTGNLYTGIDLFKVIAVNPNMEQLNALGIASTKEPEYLGSDKKGDQYIRVDFWLQGITQKRPIKFTTFLYNAIRVDKTGAKFQYINDFGKCAWGTDTELPAVTWFKPAGARKAFMGEEQLISFIRAWVNAGEDDMVSIENWDNIFRGNTKEFQEIFQAFKDNTVRCMMQVRVSEDGKAFQEINPQHFTRAYVTSNKGWIDAFKNYPPKAIYSYEVKPYQMGAPVPDEEAPTATSVWA